MYDTLFDSIDGNDSVVLTPELSEEHPCGDPVKYEVSGDSFDTFETTNYPITIHGYSSCDYEELNVKAYDAYNNKIGEITGVSRPS